MSTRLPNPSYNTVAFESKGSVILDNGGSSGTGTGTHQGRFGAIQVLKDVTITDIEGIGVTNIEKLEDFFVTGTVLYGVFTKVSITSGLVALHCV